MIQANELRIGNLVYIHGNKLASLSTNPSNLQIFEIVVVTKQSEHKWFPIPLTTKILLKCGFIQKGESYILGHNDTAFHLTPDWRDQPSFMVGIEYTDSVNRNDDSKVYDFACEIKHLHQLQNLIFLLINKELKINL